MFEFRCLCTVYVELHAPSPASRAGCAPAGTNCIFQINEKAKGSSAVTATVLLEPAGLGNQWCTVDNFCEGLKKSEKSKQTKVVFTLDVLVQAKISPYLTRTKFAHVRGRS